MSQPLRVLRFQSTDGEGFLRWWHTHWNDNGWAFLAAPEDQGGSWMWAKPVLDRILSLDSLDGSESLP